MELTDNLKTCDMGRKAAAGHARLLELKENSASATVSLPQLMGPFILAADYINL